MATIWVLVFMVAALALVRAGVDLARSGDVIAVRTGIGGLAAGAVLVASATSLPEVITAVSAAVADAPDVAVGDILGSSMANMAILAVVDLLHRGGVWPTVELGHTRIGIVAIGLTALVAFALLTPPAIAVGWVGIDTILVAGCYIAALAWVRRSPGRTWEGVLPAPIGWGTISDSSPSDTTEVAPAREASSSLRSAVVRFIGGAVVVFLAAPVVAISAREIAITANIEQTVVGVVLVGITTSLPELVASLAAVRIGAHDLAVGNLLGSNAANVAILLLVDVAYTDGPILGAVAPSQAVVAVGSIVLMSLAIAAISHGEGTTLRRFEPDALLLLLAYAGVLAGVIAVQS